MMPQVPLWERATECLQRARGLRGNGIRRPQRTVCRGAFVPAHASRGRGLQQGVTAAAKSGWEALGAWPGTEQMLRRRRLKDSLTGASPCTWPPRRWVPCWASLQNSAGGSELSLVSDDAQTLERDWSFKGGRSLHSSFPRGRAQKEPHLGGTDKSPPLFSGCQGARIWKPGSYPPASTVSTFLQAGTRHPTDGMPQYELWLTKMTDVSRPVRKQLLKTTFWGSADTQQ